MRRCTIHIFLFLISIVYWYGDAAALTEENILGGVYELVYKNRYQVLILAKKNFSDEFHVVCHGAIIDDWYVITAAQCFMNLKGELKPFAFYIAADVFNLNDASPQSIKRVDIIYIPDYVSSNYIDDIAIAKLSSTFAPPIKYRMSNLSIPNYRDEFFGIVGTVAGYECNAFHNNSINNSTNARTNFLLKATKFLIVHDNYCRLMYYPATSNRQLYGLLISYPNRYWGLCEHDIGSPLVVENKIVGIVSKVSQRCNDAIYGAIFTNVANFQVWIQIIMIGKSVDLSAFIFKNPRHIK